MCEICSKIINSGITRRGLLISSLLAITTLSSSCSTLKRSLARLSNNIPQPTDKFGELGVGCSIVDITPLVSQDNGYPIGGYGNFSTLFKSRKAYKVVDKIYCRAIILENGIRKICIASLDTLIISAKLKEAVEDKIKPGVILDDLMLCATHNHSGLGGYIDNQLAEVVAMGHFRKEIFSFIVDRIASCINQANNNIVPARLGVSVKDVYGFSKNRRTEGGLIDPSLGVIKIEDLNGKLRCIIVNFTAHPTTLGEVEYFSGDFPGYLQRYVEEFCEVCLFINGALGDQMPWYAHGNVEDKLEKARLIGISLGKEAINISNNIHIPLLETTVRLNSITSQILLPYIDIYSLYGCLRPVFEFYLPYKTYVQVIMINNTAIVGTPCDLATEVGLKIKKGLKIKRDIVFVVSQANDYIGYVLSNRDYHHGGYEASLSFYGDNIDTVLVNEITRIADMIP